MNVDLEREEEVNLVKDARARSNACYKCGKVGHFEQDCKYDGDRPTENHQVQREQLSPEPYNPVVGKWMTNLVLSTPITAKAMKSIYAELNKQKDLKRTYCKKYSDLQAAVTIAEQNVMVQQPTGVTNTKLKPALQVLKVVLGGKNKGAAAKSLLLKKKLELQNLPLQPQVHQLGLL